MRVIDEAEYIRFARALAIVESSNNEKVWGDGKSLGALYQACGRWQMHPAFVWEYSPDEVELHDSWDEVFAKTLRNFYVERWAVMPHPERIAMEFHLGVAAVKEGKWAEGYAQDFAKAFYDLQPGAA